MATLTVTKNYADATILLSTDLDDIISSLETFFNTTQLSDENFQTSSITASEKIANDSITGDKMASAIADGTTVQYSSSQFSVVSASIDSTMLASSSVTGAKVADDAITAAKISASAAITHAKRASRAVTTDGTDPGAGGISKSASCSAFSTTSGTNTDVTNLAVTLTTNGRPVMIFLESDGSGTASGIGGSTADYQITFTLDLIRDGSTTVYDTYFKLPRNPDSYSGTMEGYIPPSSILHIDPVASGTYTYKVQVAKSGITTFKMNYTRLVALEL